MTDRPTAPEYTVRRLDDWALNTQIARLHGYATAASGCLRYQFFGEYLHALQDTFAHRDGNNTPHPPGSGHLWDGKLPDSTYDQPRWHFTVNEARTLRMQEVVFGQLQALDGTTPHASFEALTEFLEKWNKMEFDTEAQQANKIRELFDELRKLGLTAPEAHRRFEKETALACRQAILQEAGLNDADGQVPDGAAERYPGAILPTAGISTYLRHPQPAGAHPCPFYD